MTDKDSETEIGRDPNAGGSRARHPLPRWVALIFLATCLGLIPQIVNLSSSLHQVETANNWRTVWVGLDIAESAVFLLTAWFLFRRSILVTITASMAAAMLWLDAWFDILTAFRRSDIDAATNLAVFVEVPLGIFCLYVALVRLGVLKVPWARNRPPDERRGWRRRH